MAFNELRRNILSENPLLVLGLGLCPAAAVSASLIDGLTMSICTTAVLIGSNIFCSIFRNLLTGRAQFLGSLIITASFTILVQSALIAVAPALVFRLGIYLPLIAVNCIVLSRIKVIATRSGIGRSLGDGLMVGIGFSIALCFIAAMREIIGANTLLGMEIIPHYDPMRIFSLAPGAFFVLALALGYANHLRLKKARGAR